MRQTDSTATLGTYYTFRVATTSARLDKQIWYVESGENGDNWSTPAGVFADCNAITIDGKPIDLSADMGDFSSIDKVPGTKACRAYFSTQDANGNFVMVSASTGGACDTLFADGFEGCCD